MVLRGLLGALRLASPLHSAAAQQRTRPLGTHSLLYSRHSCHAVGVQSSRQATLQARLFWCHASTSTVPHHYCRCSPQPLRQGSLRRCGAAHRPRRGPALHSLAGDQQQQPLPVKPLVVLIAWLGAQQRHFDKYIQLWQGWGHDTLAVRPATAAIVLPPLGDRQAAAFLERLRAAQAAQPGRPTVYHIFSNAGFLFFGTMLRALAAAEPALAPALRLHGAAPELPSGWQPLQPGRVDGGAPAVFSSVLAPTSGIILDSAPSRITPDIAAKGFVSAALSRPADTIESERPRLVAAARAAFGPVLQLPYIRRRTDQVWGAWQSVAPPCPRLLLHSTCDVLIPPSEVARFAQLQRAAGCVPVRQVEWPDSPHCEHLRRYPAQYRAALQDFLASDVAPFWQQQQQQLMVQQGAQEHTVRQSPRSQPGPQQACQQQVEPAQQVVPQGESDEERGAGLHEERVQANKQ